MGLTVNSVGLKATDLGLNIQKHNINDVVVALAGNPNVGKSTVFNELTGLKQHTGNWPGKTVTNACGYCEHDGNGIVLVDIPGCYSLMAHSAEEEVARDFICFGGADKTVVVCDATCLERNLNLVLQTLEITDNCIVCINLIDEAKRKCVRVDTKRLSDILGVPVIATAARSGTGLRELTSAIIKDDHGEKHQIKYPEFIEESIRIMTPHIKSLCERYNLNPRWLALRLIDCDSSLKTSFLSCFGRDIFEDEEIKTAISEVNTYLAINRKTKAGFTDCIAVSIIKEAEKIYKETVNDNCEKYALRDKKIDRILTSKYTGFPIMILLLAIIFWITVSGANYPSDLISRGLFYIEDRILEFLIYIGTPYFIYEPLIHGVYRVLAWVVSVMLPPMAIFFPLFTLLEDLGYLPRIAFNLDKCFNKCNACGKQSLTMCMGFGCNAAGIVGCRIIDSPRERLIAMLTNCFVPCNGRFPGLISIITMFFVFGASGVTTTILSSAMLTLLILFGIGATLIVSKLLSMTVLKGVPSSFTLELPPYRRPQILKVIVRSIFDRTLFVLSRAVAVAAPAGLIIWVLANVTVDNTTLLRYCTDFLNPFASVFGIDGVILMAFILGFPANEIVIPIIIMSYMANGSLADITDLAFLKALFLDNGWTALTALNVMLFSLMHWPCSTTLLTIKKESGSIKWTALAFALPTVIGLLTCFITTLISKLF